MFTGKLNKTSNQDRIASDAWADHLCWIAIVSKKGVFFLMFNPQTAIVVSIFLAAFIGIAKFRRDPGMLLGGLAAFGMYYFLFLHNTLLGIFKQVTRSSLDNEDILAALKLLLGKIY
ncbi:MAG TPA: hypothetical protein V6D37_11785 [Candidatus Sericytochromatia bacterium]